MRDLWYKDAIIYCLDVETYQDDNADGIGDFAGLTRRLDHLAGLGITCLWLLPFYPTPNRDNGYDILDYYGVDHRLGTLGDFVAFMHAARERGIRVIVDLVVNHTSNEHPWFQEARDPDSEKHDWYVWADERPEDGAQPLIFEGDEPGSIWTYDRKARQYYMHRFYKHQPDLNIANPAVREEITKIMGFWLELGVSGFRLDAAPYMIELKGIEGEAKVAEPYAYLRAFRDFLQWRRGDAILLAEANVGPDQVTNYFGDGKRLHMLFNFVLNQELFLALARQEAEPIKKGLEKPPALPQGGQWATFLRNHDELNLGQLSDEEREEVFAAFAPEEEMRIYNRGIRRRMPPMLGGDERRLRMAYSLLFSLPGTPVLRYGQEIGMGDDLELEDRRAVRTGMQWSDEPNAGFSKAAEKKLARPVITDGPYRYDAVNVARQRRVPDSRLNWMERLIRTRKEHHAFGWGGWTIIETNHPAVFAHACHDSGGEDRAVSHGAPVLAVHNLSDEACTATLDLEAFLEAHGGGHFIDLLGDQEYNALDDIETPIDLEGYGFRWFRLEREA